MGRPRVTDSMRKLLLDMKDAKASSGRGGVMEVPPIASLDEWEKEARTSQDALIVHTRDGPPPPLAPAPKPDPHAENERLYREHRQHMKDGLKEYREAKEAEVRRATRTVVR